MSAAENIAVANRFYQARGDRSVTDQAMSHDVFWDIAPGFPLGGEYRGLDAVLSDFLGPLAAHFTSIATHREQLLADGDGHVIAIGHYSVAGRSGSQVDCRFTHVWTVSDGRLSHLHQTADSAVLTSLLEDQGR